jgi:hypothetical protein
MSEPRLHFLDLRTKMKNMESHFEANASQECMSFRAKGYVNFGTITMTRENNWRAGLSSPRMQNGPVSRT